MSKRNVIYLLLLFLYAGVAAVAFSFASLSQEVVFEKGQIVGVLLALSVLPYFLVFVLEDGFNNPKKSVYAAFGVIGVALGITCFFLESKNVVVLDTICMIRGIFDIVRLTIILTDIISMILIEKRWIELVEFFVSVGEAIIAVFLIIDGFEGVRTHFFYMGCAFVILFAKYLVENFLERKKHHEKCSDSN